MAEMLVYTYRARRMLRRGSRILFLSGRIIALALTPHAEMPCDSRQEMAVLRHGDEFAHEKRNFVPRSDVNDCSFTTIGAVGMKVV